MLLLLFVKKRENTEYLDKFPKKVGAKASPPRCLRLCIFISNNNLFEFLTTYK